MSAARLLFSVLALLAFPTTAFAHTMVTSPSPRVDSDSIKESSAPCGGPRGSTIHQLDPGQMLTIEYDETVAHQGHFELRFSMAGDTNWMSLDDNIPDQGGVGSYEHTFQVPDVECADCTFQFIQVMTDRNPPQNYYSCIDVAIGSDTTPVDMGMGGADMGTDAGNTNNGTNSNNTNPGTDNGPDNNANPNNNVNPPAPDMGDADAGVTNIDASGTCAVAGDYPTREVPIGLLAVFGLTLWWGRRRSSRGSAEAPR